MGIAAGQGRPKAMLSAASALLSRLAPAEAISRRDALALVIITVLHLAALAVMTATELDLATKATFLFFWALLIANRPGVRKSLNYVVLGLGLWLAST